MSSGRPITHSPPLSARRAQESSPGAENSLDARRAARAAYFFSQRVGGRLEFSNVTEVRDVDGDEEMRAVIGHGEVAGVIGIFGGQASRYSTPSGMNLPQISADQPTMAPTPG